MGIIARTVTSRVVDDMAVRLAGATEHAIDEIVRRRSDAIRVAVEVERLRHPGVEPRDLARMLVYQRSQAVRGRGWRVVAPGRLPGPRLGDRDRRRAGRHGRARLCAGGARPGRGRRLRPRSRRARRPRGRRARRARARCRRGEVRQARRRRARRRRAARPQRSRAHRGAQPRAGRAGRQAHRAQAACARCSGARSRSASASRSAQERTSRSCATPAARHCATTSSRRPAQRVPERSPCARRGTPAAPTLARVTSDAHPPRLAR